MCFLECINHFILLSWNVTGKMSQAWKCECLGNNPHQAISGEINKDVPLVNIVV